MRKLCLFLLLVGAYLFAQNSPVVIRIATSVPEGSTWVKSMQALSQETKRTMNVQIIIYAGGTAGEAKAVLEKIKYGQLDGGGFVGSTLGEFCPRIRVLDIPCKYNSLEEWKYVFKNIRTDLTEDFEKSNFMVLGWGYGGFVDIYSKQPIRTLADFQAAKIWFSPGDPMMEGFFREMKIHGIPLETSAIFPALQTGIVNCVYNSPYGLMAMQWHTNVRYCTKYPIINPLGTVIISKAAYERIPAQYRKLFLKACKKHLGITELGEDAEQKNQEAMKDLQTRFKIEVIEPDPAWIAKTKEVGEKVGKAEIGKFYSQEFYDRVLKLQEEYRQKNK